MELVITPTACKPTKDEAGQDVPAAFNGTITIRIPSMPESYRFKAKYGKRTVGLGMSEMSKEQSTFVSMELLADIAEDVKGHFLKVDITDVASKKTITSIDELYCYEPAFAIIADVAMRFIQGFAEKN